MKNIERNISKLVNRFIKESFVDITDMDTDAAVEEVTEKTHGKDKKFGDGRDKIDVAKPKGKITGADFRKLQSMKKKEMDENYGIEDEMGGGYYKYDNPNRHKASKLADRFPGVTFSDDDLNKSEDELTADYEKIMGKRKRFDVNDPNFRSPGGFKSGELVFEEGETEEGNEFTGALAKAKEEGKDTFTVDGKEYNVTKESVNRKIERILERRRGRLEEKWNGDVEVEKTGEYSDMSIEDLNSAIKKQKSKNDKTKEAGKKVSDSDKTKMSQLYFAKRAKQGWKGKGKAAVKENKVVFTESELIDFIERIVESEIKTDKDTTNALSKTKKVNSDATKEVVEKMKDYMKNMGMEYKENAEEFPKGNKKMSREDYGKSTTDEKKKAYKASNSVEEYIDQIARSGGMEVLEYDQIKPNEEWMDMNIEGSSKTGNSQEYANAVPTDVNKNVNRRRKLNILNKLKKQSYQKAEQPVYDVAGEDTHLDKMLGIEESVENRKDKKINEDMEKMKKLINYGQKTQ